MKKFFSIFLLLSIFASVAMKADDTTPNRMLIEKAGGAYKAYNVDRVSGISFATVDGRVACDIEYISCTENSVQFDLYKEASCVNYLINVFPATVARQLEANPGGAEEYMKLYNSPQDDREGQGFNLSGLELTAGGEYAIVTLGFDKYECAGEVAIAEFQVPTAPLVGNPQVTATVTNRTLNSVSVKFVANADVKGFAAVIGEKGQMQSQYDMFGPMFGFASFAEMIKGWGMNFTGNSTNTYEFTQLNPNQEYEIFIQAWDKAGTYAPYTVLETSTLAQGGEGASVITITPGAYKTEQWGDELLPSQYFKFTPNDQTSAYRFGVYFADDYDADKAKIIAALKSDPEQPIAYWFFYEETQTDYQINPNTEVVAIAAGKNIKGEWGEVTELRYTTPSKVSGKPAAKIGTGDLKSRIENLTLKNEAGKMRTMPKLSLGK